MRELKVFMITLSVLVLSFLIPNISNAAVNVSRNVYSSNGSMKFNFTGLTLDTSHEYEFGLTKTKAAAVETWHLITEYTETTATVDVITTTKDLREVINAVDTGYITIKDKNTDTVILEPTAVDLKTPFLQVSNYTVIPNGKEIYTSDKYIQIALRNAANSEAYYQYEKITDTAVIKKYKELKANNGDYLELQSLLKQTAPTSNWQTWNYWNGHDSGTGMNGFGETQRIISVPDSGLYYMWLYFSGNNLKNVYGCILVDNLEPDIALESVSLPKTETIKLGETLTLMPTFNPTNATNKIVIWSSSDESVATVSNAGLITAKKVGSTIITVVSQDGNKKATCTVTVTDETANNTKEEEKNSKADSSTSSTETKDSKETSKTVTPKVDSEETSAKEDKTTASSVLPKTGAGLGLIISIIAVLGIGTFAFVKIRNYRDI